jgi:hypothetical protein
VRSSAARRDLFGCRNSGARELVGNVGLERLRGSDVGDAARVVAHLELGDAPPVERTRRRRLALQHRVVIDDGAVELAELQVNKAATVESIRIVPQPQRLVAIGKCLLRLADDGKRVAALVESLGVLGIEPDRLVEVRDGAVEVTRRAVRGATVIIGDDVLGGEPDRLAEVSNGEAEVAPGAVYGATVFIGEDGPGNEPVAGGDNASPARGRRPWTGTILTSSPMQLRASVIERQHVLSPAVLSEIEDEYRFSSFNGGNSPARRAFQAA